MNFSFKTKAFSEPCILIESFRTLNGGLARSYVRLDNDKDERDAIRTHHGERFDLARRHVSDCRKHILVAYSGRFWPWECHLITYTMMERIQNQKEICVAIF